MVLVVLTAMGAACAHAPAARERKAAGPEMVFVTGSHIRQPVDPATGAVRSTYPIRIYSREQLDGTGRQSDLSAALRMLSP
jgi:hypothetical protein